jgi:predicted HAD superfamily Cof-like phosphohydrolase
MNPVNKMVAEFQQTFETPKDPEMWAGLVHEETNELLQAFVNVMKELADLNYVIAGYLNICEENDAAPREGERGDKLYQALMALDIIEFWLQHGVPLPKTLELVHEANMSKVGDDGEPLRDSETGKILKGPNYKPPEPRIAGMLYSRARYELESIVNSQKENAE